MQDVVQVLKEREEAKQEPKYATVSCHAPIEIKRRVLETAGKAGCSESAVVLLALLRFYGIEDPQGEQ